MMCFFVKQEMERKEVLNEIQDLKKEKLVQEEEVILVI
jgi:hypothetical protein